MRGVVWGLVLINVLFAIWQVFLADTQDEVTPVPTSLELRGSLRLLGEVDESDLKLRELESAAVQVPAQEGVCVEVGPFASQQDALAWRSQVQSPEWRPIEYDETVAVNYRASIAPLETTGQATQVLERLQRVIAEQAIRTDAFLISSGDLRNGISLGLFGARDNAIAVRTALEAQGFSVLVREEPRLAQQFWLASTQYDSFADFESWWSQIDQGQIELEPREKLCETIALEF